MRVTDLRLYETPLPNIIIFLLNFILRPIPGTGTLKLTVTASGCSNNNHVKYLEHVQAVITLTFTRRGDLSIKLISPRGTVAILLPQRRSDYSGSGFTDWEFMSTHTWGEDPKGTWTLEIENHGKKNCVLFLIHKKY